MTVWCTPQEARAFVKERINNRQELPHDIDFGSTNNHLASALIFIALGEPEQVFNLQQVYGAFRVRTPKDWEKEEGASRSSIRDDAYSKFTAYEEEARERVEKGQSSTILDGIQFSSANMWKVDDDITTTFAVNSQGVAVGVMNTIGWANPNDNSYSAVSNRERLQRDLERSIDLAEF